MNQKIKRGYSMAFDYKSDEDGKIYAVIYNRQGQGNRKSYTDFVAPNQK